MFVVSVLRVLRFVLKNSGATRQVLIAPSALLHGFSKRCELFLPNPKSCAAYYEWLSGVDRWTARSHTYNALLHEAEYGILDRTARGTVRHRTVQSKKSFAQVRSSCELQGTLVAIIS